jgi:hypothetical protein
MYDSTGFSNLSFGLFAASRQHDASRLLNNVELLVEDVEGHLAQVGPNGVGGFESASVSDLTDAVETAREVVTMIKSQQS